MVSKFAFEKFLTQLAHHYTEALEAAAATAVARAGISTRSGTSPRGGEGSSTQPSPPSPHLTPPLTPPLIPPQLYEATLTRHSTLLQASHRQCPTVYTTCTGYSMIKQSKAPLTANVRPTVQSDTRLYRSEALSRFIANERTK